MKTSFFTLLGVGLTSVLAAPAPSAENELTSRTTCALPCPFGQIGQLNEKTQKCKCVTINEEYCKRETICIGTHYAYFNESTKSCACAPYDFVAEDKCLQNQICITTSFAVYDQESKECYCKPYDFAGEAKCLKEKICVGTQHAVWYPKTSTCVCEAVVFENDPETICKTATSCVTGSHPFWNSSTKKCSCNDNNAENICKTATLCPPNTFPVWNASTETCNCVKSTYTKRQDEETVDPSTCPTIRCMEGYQPKYIKGQAHCICEKIPEEPSCLLYIKCAKGYVSTRDPKTNQCSCKLDPTLCTDWMCIAEQIPVYNATTGKCGCQWIPGLEPVNPCADVLCISEMTPTVDESTGTCKCVWIPGLEPTPVTSSTQATKTSKATATPTEYDPLNCKRLKIYCPYGDHYSHYNPKTKQCECPPKSGTWF